MRWSDIDAAVDGGRLKLTLAVVQLCTHTAWYRLQGQNLIVRMHDEFAAQRDLGHDFDYA